MNMFKRFSAAAFRSSSSNEHLPALAVLASECSHVTELGVDRVCTSWGLLFGLTLSRSEKKRFVGVDIARSHEVDELESVCAAEGVDYTFHLKSSVEIELEETDLLFIDTEHTYGHLKRELELHHGKVRKFLAFHDTSAPFGQYLNPAIGEFLLMHQEWENVYRYEHNHGLTVLRRRGT